MCTANQLQIITKEVAGQAKALLDDKLEAVILYGSYARGDYDEHSDIDMMILAHIPPEECWHYTEKLSDRMTELELNYDIMISVHTVSADLFEHYNSDLPFYGNVNREGIRIAV